jgi:allantoin racemase
MSRSILVINPNSNESVTEGLRASLEAGASDVIVDCCTLSDGPFGIESDLEVETVAPLVVSKIESADRYDAFVIACYSDPGLARCRDTIPKPVFGMQQSALETAVAIGGRFGVLALSDTSIARHLMYIESLGLADKLAGEVSLDISVDDSANDPRTLDKVITRGRHLIDEYGANALILGCAGMAAIRRLAERELPVPVIEPAQAALDLAIEAA